MALEPGALGTLLLEVWRQVFEEHRTAVEVSGEIHPVGRTRGRRLRLVTLRFGGRTIEGIEQNPEKSSRWAELAQQGKRIMQFSCDHRYFANVAEGKLTRYPAWRSLGLPD